MTALLQPDPTWRRAVRRTRFSVVLTVIAILGVSGYLGWKEGYFTPVAHFYFDSTSSKSLRKGMPVRLSGFKIGQVNRVELQPDRSVRVGLAIFRSYLDFVKTDSEIRLEADIPLGDPSLEVVGGSAGAPNAVPDSALRFRNQQQSYDRLVGFVEHLEPMIENLTALLSQARQPQSELQVSLRSIAETSTRVQAWMPGFLERSDAALASLNRAIALATTTLTPLSSTDGDLQTALRDVRVSAADLRAALPPLLTDFKELTGSLRTSALTLEPAVNRLAPQLPGLVDEGRRTAANANEVVEAVKDFSLIRRKIDQRPAETVLPTTPP